MASTTYTLTWGPAPSLSPTCCTFVEPDALRWHRVLRWRLRHRKDHHQLRAQRLSSSLTCCTLVEFCVPDGNECSRASQPTEDHHQPRVRRLRRAHRAALSLTKSLQNTSPGARPLLTRSSASRRGGQLSVSRAMRFEGSCTSSCTNPCTSSLTEILHGLPTETTSDLESGT